MTDKPRVEVGQAGLLLRDPGAGTAEPLPFLAGAMHYYHVPRRHWGRCLDRFVELGLPLVDTYVPWAIHERAPGRYDFGDGPVTDGFERDLGGFLDACTERGLKVILRPGPHINGELTYFGFPQRVLADARCLAVGSLGNPVVLPVPPRAFAVPSYASKTFLQEASVWLRAFGDFAAPYCWPAGPVVAAQVDNELALFFRTGAYDQDYHDDALVLWRRFLGNRYPDGLPAAAYGAGAQLDALEPPRSMDASTPAGLVRHLDWLAAREWIVVKALAHLAKILRMTGFDRVPLTHNFPASVWGEACSLPAVEAELDLAGLDVYLRASEYGQAKAAAQLMAGCSRLPVVPELGCGSWPWWFPLPHEEQQRVALSLLMHGVKGFALYMFVERDRWYGAPVGLDGAKRHERFEGAQRLVRAVQETRLPELARDVPVALMRVRDYERLAICASLADPAPPIALGLLGLGMEELCSEEHFGLAGPPALEYAAALRRATEVLTRLRVPFVIVDSDVSAARLARHRLVLLPGLSFIDRDVLARLAAFVDGGGAVVIAGRTPSLDAAMAPLAVDLPGGEAVALDTLEAELEARLDALGVARGDGAVDPDVDVEVYGAGADRVTFVANRSSRTRTVTAAVLGAAEDGELWDALTGGPVRGELRLGPYDVRMLRARPRSLTDVPTGEQVLPPPATEEAS